MSGISWAEVFAELCTQFAAFASVLLLASALHKAISRERSLAAVRELGGVPRPLAAPALGIAAVVELIAAVALFSPRYRAAGACLAAVLWLGYLCLIVRAIAQGRRDIDCGCSFGAARHPLGSYHVLRNAILACGCAAAAGGSAAFSAPPFSATEVLAAVGLLALYGALDQVTALSAPRPGELL